MRGLGEGESGSGTWRAYTTGAGGPLVKELFFNGAPGGCEGINLNKKINFYKNSFLVIFGVKFHATALACTPTDAQKRGASF